MLLCSDQFCMFMDYIHHSPHFDKPHDYHVPGFRDTRRLYKEVSNVCVFFYCFIDSDWFRCLDQSRFHLHGAF
jgi:hypothetical protein